MPVCAFGRAPGRAWVSVAAMQASFDSGGVEPVTERRWGTARSTKRLSLLDRVDQRRG
jgi:hypothetical protein